MSRVESCIGCIVGTPCLGWKGNRVHTLTSIHGILKTVEVTMSDLAKSPHISIDQSLLVEASWMLREGHRTAAVLIAMKACEVVVARAIHKKLVESNVGHLYPCLREAVGESDFRHRNPCQLYEAVTRHPIRQEASDVGLWSRFLEALSHQDKILFEGVEIQSDDAEGVIDVATRFIKLVVQANKL